MLYAADIFLTPQQNAGTRAKYECTSQATISKLATIQRWAALMITGVMKTTAMDVLEVMANLLLFHLFVDKCWHHAAICLATLPCSHPLYKPVANTANKLVKQHPTPLHDVMHRYGIQPHKIETIEAVHFDTGWKPGLTTEVITDTDKAIEAIQNNNSDIKVFTNSSGMEGKIGVAAVLYVRATPLNILKQVSCGLYKKIRIGWDVIDGVIVIQYDQEQWGAVGWDRCITPN